MGGDIGRGRLVVRADAQEQFVAVRALSAAGASWARMRPWSMMQTRSQLSTSSM